MSSPDFRPGSKLALLSDDENVSQDAFSVYYCIDQIDSRDPSGIAVAVLACIAALPIPRVIAACDELVRLGYLKEMSQVTRSGGCGND